MRPYVTVDDLRDKTRDWMARIRPFNDHKMVLAKDRCALLVIDMQRFFLEPEGAGFTCGGVAVVPEVRTLIDAFRTAGRPVIYTRHVHHPDHLDSGLMATWWDGMCLEDSPESEIHPSIAPAPGEKVVLKHRYSGFYNTDLETVLRCLKIEDVVITGVMTNLCCETTARDAFQRDIRVFFAADATGTITEEMHLATLLNLAFGFACVTTGSEIRRQLLG